MCATMEETTPCPFLVPREALGRPPPEGSTESAAGAKRRAPERGQQVGDAPRSGRPGWLPSRDRRTDGSRKNKTWKQHVSPCVPSSGQKAGQSWGSICEPGKLANGTRTPVPEKPRRASLGPWLEHRGTFASRPQHGPRRLVGWPSTDVAVRRGRQMPCGPHDRRRPGWKLARRKWALRGLKCIRDDRVSTPGNTRRHFLTLTA